MFLSDWRVLLRRWYVALLGLLGTAVLCYAAAVVVPVKYQATADVLLLPPKVNSTGKAAPQGDNPFLSLGGLDTVSAVLAKTLSDRATQLAVQQAGGSGTFTVVQDLMAGGPVLLVTVTGSTPAAALGTLAAVTNVVPSTLARLQTTSGVPANALIRAKWITKDATAQPVRKSQLRAMLVAVAAGLGGTVLLTALFDGYLARRKASTRGSQGGAAPVPASPAAPEEAYPPPGPRRPPPGEPVPWQPATVPGLTTGGALSGAPSGGPPFSAGQDGVPNGSAAGHAPAVSATADPDATVVLHDLRAAADPSGAPAEARPGHTGSRRHGLE